MPFALVFAGLILIVSGAKGTQGALGAQLKQDFTGTNNFLFWIAAIGALGALGYVKELRTFSRYMMALVVLAIVLANGRNGFFQKLKDGIGSSPVTPKSTASAPAPASNASASASPAASTGQVASAASVLDFGSTLLSGAGDVLSTLLV